MTDQKKLEDLLTELKHNPNSFATALGYRQAGRIYHILNGRTGISRAVKNDILRVFPQVSEDWLLYSKGTILSIKNSEGQKHEIYNVIEALEENPSKENWIKLKSLVFDVIKTNETYKGKLLAIRESLTSGMFK